MVRGKVEIFLSPTEPEDKNILWLKSKPDKDGYDLLYFGAGGWTSLIESGSDTGTHPLQWYYYK